MYILLVLLTYACTFTQDCVASAHLWHLENYQASPPLTAGIPVVFPILYLPLHPGMMILLGTTTGRRPNGWRNWYEWTCTCIILRLKLSVPELFSKAVRYKIMGSPDSHALSLFADFNSFQIHWHHSIAVINNFKVLMFAAMYNKLFPSISKWVAISQLDY